MDAKLEVFNEIKKYDSIVIFGHRLPDGDCYGSQIGLRELLKLNFPNKKVYAVGTGIPAFFDLLGKMDEVDEETIKHSLGVVIDMAGEYRSEDERVNLAPARIKIDHHIDELGFPSVKWVDVNANAVCQMVIEFALTFNLKMNETIANALYLGIVTDSGRFQFSPYQAKTYQLVAELFKYGLDIKKVFDILYSVDEKIMKYKGYMMLNYQKTEHNVVYLKVKKEVYHEFDLKFSQISNQVNVIGNIKGSPIWLLFTENDEDGTIRVEYRSKGINVQKIAVKFGGGGHHCASGSKVAKDEGWAKVDEIIAYCDLMAEKGEEE